MLSCKLKRAWSEVVQAYFKTSVTLEVVPGLLKGPGDSHPQRDYEIVVCDL
jgi:hypothetical protein